MSIKKKSVEKDVIVKLNVQLRGESADQFRRIKAYLNLESDTEVIRTIIQHYYKAHEKELSGPPKTMWHLNLDSNGVLIWDPDLQKAVHINFTPKGIVCQQDQTDDCRHVVFASAQEVIREVIKERQKEGWKIELSDE
jgi:hypothetical protein